MKNLKYYYNNNCVAEIQNGLLTIIDSSILNNKELELVSSDGDIIIVKNLQHVLNKQNMNEIHKKMLISYEDEQ